MCRGCSEPWLRGTIHKLRTFLGCCKVKKLILKNTHTSQLMQSDSQLELGKSVTWLKNLGQDRHAEGGLFLSACSSRGSTQWQVSARLLSFLVDSGWRESDRKMEWKSWAQKRSCSWSSHSQVCPWTLQTEAEEHQFPSDSVLAPRGTCWAIRRYTKNNQ